MGKIKGKGGSNRSQGGFKGATKFSLITVKISCWIGCRDHELVVTELRVCLETFIPLLPFHEGILGQNVLIVITHLVFRQWNLYFVRILFQFVAQPLGKLLSSREIGGTSDAPHKRKNKQRIYRKGQKIIGFIIGETHFDPLTVFRWQEPRDLREESFSIQIQCSRGKNIL